MARRRGAEEAHAAAGASTRPHPPTHLTPSLAKAMLHSCARRWTCAYVVMVVGPSTVRVTTSVFGCHLQAKATHRRAPQLMMMLGRCARSQDAQAAASGKRACRQTRWRPRGMDACALDYVS